MSKSTRVRRNAGLLLMAVTVLLSTLMIPTVASADNWGSEPCAAAGPNNVPPRRCVHLGDNTLHQWCEDGTVGNQVPGILAAVVEAMDDYDFYTVITTEHYCPITVHRDVIIADFDYGNNGYTGWTECVPGTELIGAHPYRSCDSQKIRFNGNSRYAWEVDTHNERLTLACHEIGHTLGLWHFANSDKSCLNNNALVTSNHDDAHINFNYS